MTLCILALLGACSTKVDPMAVPEDMAKHQPSDGLAELRKLFAAGHVRAASQAEIDDYVRIANAALPPGVPSFSAGSMVPSYTLILIRPFKATRQMGEMTVRHIIVPVGVGKNDDPNPLFAYYYMESGRCNVPGGNCLGAPRMDAAWHARARRLDREEPPKADLSEAEREDGYWPESGTKAVPPNRASDPLGQLPMD